MAHKRDTSPRNPLKDENQSKRTTKELGDQAPAGPGRQPAQDQAGSAADRVRRENEPEHADEGATSRAAAVGPWVSDRQHEAGGRGVGPDVPKHPGEHGGVRADDPSSDPQNQRPAERPGVKRGPSPTDEPSSERTGTADGGGRSRRTGKTGENRHEPRE